MKKIIVSEDLMNRITALCDVLEHNEDKVLSNTAKSIRKEINKGLDYLNTKSLSN